MRIFTLAAIALGTAIAGQPLSAQQESEPGPSWSFSLGADPTRFDLRTRDPGVDARLIANLARTWQMRGGLTGHVAMMVGADAPRGLEDSQSGVRVDASHRYGALTAGLGYEMFRGRRISPYITAGTGIYRERMRSDLSCLAAGCNPPATAMSRGIRGTTLGINAAAGLNMKVAGRNFFLEQKLHAFDINRIDHGVHPLSFGIRF